MRAIGSQSEHEFSPVLPESYAASGHVIKLGPSEGSKCGYYDGMMHVASILVKCWGRTGRFLQVYAFSVCCGRGLECLPRTKSQ